MSELRMRALAAVICCALPFELEYWIPPMIIEIVTATPTNADNRLIKGLMYFLIRSQLLAVQVELAPAAGSVQLFNPLFEPHFPDRAAHVASLPVVQVEVSANAALPRAIGASSAHNNPKDRAICLKYLFNAVILHYYTAKLRPNQLPLPLFLDKYETPAMQQGLRAI